MLRDTHVRLSGLREPQSSETGFWHGPDEPGAHDPGHPGAQLPTGAGGRSGHGGARGGEGGGGVLGQLDTFPEMKYTTVPEQRNG